MTLSIWFAFGRCLTFENPQIYTCIFVFSPQMYLNEKTQHFLEKHAAGENNLMMLSNVFRPPCWPSVRAEQLHLTDFVSRSTWSH